MLVAGVDVGNTTTEVVIIDASKNPPDLLAWDRVATRGMKGSAEAYVGAAELVRRLERRIERRVELVAAAPQLPVTTRLASVSQSTPDTGRLEVLSGGGDTAGGEGVAVGIPVWGNTQAREVNHPILLLFPVGTGFKATVAAFSDWTHHGNDIRGLLLADDEAVLVSARLNLDLPIADQIDVERVSLASMVALEVRPAGHALKELTDPIRLSYLLGLSESERGHALAVGETLGDSSRGLVLVHAQALARMSLPAISVIMQDENVASAIDPVLLSSRGVGAVRSYTVPVDGGNLTLETDDVWAVALREIAASVSHRIDATTSRTLVVAALTSERAKSNSAFVLGEEMGVTLKLLPAEATAARVGAFTTPAARQGALVADLGGGTIDVMGPGGGEVVAAGAGEMLTAGVAAFLRIPRGAAEWVKRGPCSRVEDSQVLLAEDGVRSFLANPAPNTALGSLVVPGPAGLLAFSGSLAPSSWRALRLRLKHRVIAENLGRALKSLDDPSPELLLVGGVAGDEELLGLLRNALPGIVVGRCDVAGKLGHRYAVAYGLALLAVS